MIDIEKGSNFTFRAWAEIPDDQNSNDDFFLNITANSRLDENNPFYLSVNTTFDAAQATGEKTILLWEELLMWHRVFLL